MSDVTRRGFVKAAGTAAGVAASLGVVGTSRESWAGANEKVRVAVVGINGRGRDHMKGWQGADNVEIAALCDVDSRLFESRIGQFFKGDAKKPDTYTDFRKLLDNKDIDAVSIATPNHTHTLLAIWALQAGKHVYVEKPCTHNVWEGRQLVNAAKKYGKVVQHGTQIRSNPGVQDGIQKLRDGVIGEVYMARGLCYRMRGDIGNFEDSPVPEGVDYDAWLGPKPVRPFNENRFHYNWHYTWAHGNGDIGNQGVHQMDVARWGLGVGQPSKITSFSGMYLWDDQKEVPNVITTGFEYPDAGPKGKMLVFDVRPWYTNDEKKAKVGILFYGSEGYMVIDSYSSYQTYLGDKETPGPGMKDGRDQNHYNNFIAAVRANDPSAVTANAEEGHLSSSLCHLGLISAKLGRSIDFDPATETITGDEEANAMIRPAYREPYVVPEITA